MSTADLMVEGFPRFAPRIWVPLEQVVQLNDAEVDINRTPGIVPHRYAENLALFHCT